MDQNPNATLVPKRKEQRLRTVLPVRIFGLDSAGKPFTDIAHTLDISLQGARIGGLKHQLAIGDIVGVQRGMEKARFRVCWVGAPATRCDGQAGLLCVQPEKCIWPGDVLGLKKHDEFIPPAFPQDGPTLTVVSETRGCDRRTHTRFSCNFGAEFEVDGSSIKLWGRCTDLSTGGCYLETRSPLKPGARLKLRMSYKAVLIEANCVVRTCHPDFGMGVRFEDMVAQCRAALSQVLTQLSEAEPASASPVPHFNLRPATSLICDGLRRFESEVEHSDVSAPLSKAIRSSCEELRVMLADFEQMADSPVRHDPELIQEQLLSRGMRRVAAQTEELAFTVGHSSLSVNSDDRHLMHASRLLTQRLQMRLREDDKPAKESSAYSHVEPLFHAEITH